MGKFLWIMWKTCEYYFYVKFVNIVNIQYIEGKHTTYIEYGSENNIFSDNRKGG